MVRYSYIGEIVSYEPDGAEEHDLDGLHTAIFRCSRPVSIANVFWRSYYYATCQVSLPRLGWEVAAMDDDAPLEGNLPWNGEVICTHCASLCGAYCAKKKYVFNHPIELHLDKKEDKELDATTDPVPARLIFQVLQVDGWERHFLEGYTFVDLPTKPGSYVLRGRLWAPRGTITERLSASFCGAFLPLASPELVAADEHQLPRNRSGLSVSSAGSLELRLQVLRQSSNIERPRRTGREARRERRERRSRRSSPQSPHSPSRPSSLEGLRRRNLRDAAEPSPRLP